MPGSSTKERRKYEKGRLIESTMLKQDEALILTKPGGICDRLLILSYYADPHKALNAELKEDMRTMIRKKQNIDCVWLTMLALYCYTKRLHEFEPKWQAAGNACMVYLRQHSIGRPEVPIATMNFEFI